MHYEYRHYLAAADYIKERISFTPEIGLILGTGFGHLADRIQHPVIIDYQDIPNFLATTVSAHAGQMLLGELNGSKVVCMSGRFHYYEGYDFEQLAIPVRVMKLLGIRNLILTNAVGAINPEYRPGDVVLIRDHIKLFGASPLRGRNIEEFGPRYVDTSNMYTAALREQAAALGRDSGLTIHEGVYYYAGGPQFETPAEIRAMRLLGADCVGMSTVTEAITAVHCGLPLLCISVVSNMAAGLQQKNLDISDIVDAFTPIQGRLDRYMESLVVHL